MDFPDTAIDQKPRRSSRSSVSTSSKTLVNDGHRYQYVVDKYSEGAVGTILLGASSFNADKLTDMINTRAKAGFRMVFQVKEQRRMLLFWTRESIVMTFERAIS